MARQGLPLYYALKPEAEHAFPTCPTKSLALIRLIGSRLGFVFLSPSSLFTNEPLPFPSSKSTVFLPQAITVVSIGSAMGFWSFSSQRAKKRPF